MSAWIVSKGHIDVLANGLVQHGLVEAKDIQSVGQMLWAENHASVNYRYDEDTKTPRYQPEVTEATVQPMHLYVAIGCYDYQSCEHDEFGTSRSFDLVNALRAKLEEEDPSVVDSLPTYDPDIEWQIQWGYESLEQSLHAPFVPVKEGA